MRILSAVSIVVALAVGAACGDDEGGTNGPAAGSGAGGTGAVGAALASATLAPKSDNTTLGGSVKFSGTPGAISITLTVTGAPAGMHGVHIHETGDCSTADAMSAGGHWNPGMAHMHGAPGPTSHIGDLGNITIAADGTGTLTLSKAEWTIPGAAETNPVGKAVIVHAMPDDLTSQPVGMAGGRIGCGVIM